MRRQDGSANDGRKGRRDGLARRALILSCALRLFYTHGFDKISVRTIAREAESNLASVYYYFGDKAGLYKAAIEETLAVQRSAFVEFDAPGLLLEESLQAYFDEQLAPLGEDEAYQMAFQLRQWANNQRCGASAVERWHCVLKRHDYRNTGEPALWLRAVAVAGLADRLPDQLADRRCVSPDALRGWAAGLRKIALAIVTAADDA